MDKYFFFLVIASVLPFTPVGKGTGHGEQEKEMYFENFKQSSVISTSVSQYKIGALHFLPFETGARGDDAHCLHSVDIVSVRTPVTFLQAIVLPHLSPRLELTDGTCHQ